VVALNFNGLRLDPDSEAPDFLKAVVATIANDDVIEHLHAEQRAGINEAARQLNVVRAGGRIAAGMIVRLMCPESLCGGVSARASTSAARRSKEGT
jgi:cytochrome oxidase Cu insertion factor (SCO1/SenC/PrrC family)